MKLDDVKISRAIIESFTRKFLDYLEVDVAIVGGGPAGMTAAFYLAESGVKVALFERKLSLGGGMWGGGMMFNEIVVQAEGKQILDEFGITVKPASDGLFCADSIETVSTILSRATRAGARVFNLFNVEDVVLIDERIQGLVLNWSAVDLAHLHVDPLTMRARWVVDATGHAAEIARLVQSKSGCELHTPTGKVAGEKPMWADIGEAMLKENTREIFPGLYTAGMCANAVFGSPRMGPIFGGMLLSGKQVAHELLEKLEIPVT